MKRYADLRLLAEFPVLKHLQPGGCRAQRAYKYMYVIADNSWYSEECLVKISEKPFAEGGMRWCVIVNLVDSGVRAVVKIFKPNVIPKAMEERAYFNEAMTQTIADSYAKVFNARNATLLGKAVRISFLPVSVLHLVESGEELCNLEPLLEGKYVKHNDNDGNVESKEEVPQAFSHFTWEASERRILVCDIQGVGNFFTDPQIHSYDGKGFGAGNLGMEGVNRFFSTHVCNSICRQLQLTDRRRPEYNQLTRASSVSDSDIDLKLGVLNRWSASFYDGAYENFRSTARRSMELTKTAAEEIRRRFADVSLSSSERKLSRSVSESQLELLAEEAHRLAEKADTCLGETCRDALEQMSLMLRVLKEKDIQNQSASISETKDTRPNSANALDRDQRTSHQAAKDDNCLCKYCGVEGKLAFVTTVGNHHSQTCLRRGNSENTFLSAHTK